MSRHVTLLTWFTVIIIHVEVSSAVIGHVDECSVPGVRLRRIGVQGVRGWVTNMAGNGIVDSNILYVVDVHYFAYIALYVGVGVAATYLFLSGAGLCRIYSREKDHC